MMCVNGIDVLRPLNNVFKTAKKKVLHNNVKILRGKILESKLFFIKGLSLLFYVSCFLLAGLCFPSLTLEVAIVDFESMLLNSSKNANISKSDLFWHLSIQLILFVYS